MPPNSTTQCGGLGQPHRTSVGETLAPECEKQKRCGRESNAETTAMPGPGGKKQNGPAYGGAGRVPNDPRSRVLERRRVEVQVSPWPLKQMGKPRLVWPPQNNHHEGDRTGEDEVIIAGGGKRYKDPKAAQSKLRQSTARDPGCGKADTHLERR